MYNTDNQVLGLGFLALPAALGLTQNESIAIYVVIGLFLLLTVLAVIFRIRNKKKN